MGIKRRSLSRWSRTLSARNLSDEAELDWAHGWRMRIAGWARSSRRARSSSTGCRCATQFLVVGSKGAREPATLRDRERPAFSPLLAVPEMARRRAGRSVFVKSASVPTAPGLAPSSLFEAQCWVLEIDLGAFGVSQRGASVYVCLPVSRQVLVEASAAEAYAPSETGASWRAEANSAGF